MNRKPIILLCPALLSAVLMVGCGGPQGPPSLADFSDTNIKKLHAAYGLYMALHNMRGPKSEEELKDYLTNNKPASVKMQRLGVPKDKIADIFISERDGQPFKVRYGIKGLGDHPIVFEAEGVDGKRMVAFGPPREVDSDEYEKLWKQDTKSMSVTQGYGAK